MTEPTGTHRGDGPRRHTVITGGCGFLGSALARRLAREGRRVRLLDNLAQPGAGERWDTLRAELPAGQVSFQVADVRDVWSVEKALRGAEAVFHLAALPMGSRGSERPMASFEVNAQGTLNVLEAVRALPTPIPLVFSSSYRVYGALDDLELESSPEGWRPTCPETAAHGVPETWPTDGYGPHGCSKCAADQYVRDSARSFGLPAVVLRFSTLYGEGLTGDNGSGWALDLLAAALGETAVALPGNGRRVSDLLFVDDAVAALLAAERSVDRLAGQAFNVGGGPAQAISANGLVERLSATRGAPFEVRQVDPRPGDPRYFVADTRRFQSQTGWRPEIGLDEGLTRCFSGLTLRSPRPATGRRPARAELAAGELRETPPRRDVVLTLPPLAAAGTA